MRVLIVEDEVAAGNRLRKMIQGIRPGYEILNQLGSVQGAVKYLDDNGCPELIFMDIRLGDGLSFGIFSQIEVTCPIIFTTAYNQYALRAFKVNSIDYLLKPIDPEELEAAITKYENLSGPSLQLTEATLQDLIRTLQTQKYKERFLVKSGKTLTYLVAEQIALFYSEDGLAFIRDMDGNRYLVDGTLEYIESLVNPNHFFRINRKALVHIQSVAAIRPHLNNRLKLDTRPAPPFDLIVARERSGLFKKWVDQM